MNRLDLTEGSIFKKIFLLSLPIMGTSFMQTGYNLVDMLFVGKVGAGAVAAVGTAGFFPWLAQAFIMIARIGGEVKVAQGLGEKNRDKVKKYIKSSIELNITQALLYSLFLMVFAGPLIHFFRIKDAAVNEMGIQYLIIIAIGMIFFFMNPVFSAIFNGMGNSKTPFKINAMCLIANMILDPILILGLFGFPRLEVVGAAIATVIAQALGSIAFLVLVIKDKSGIFRVKYFRNIEFIYHKEIVRLGFPVGIQSAMFTVISMFIGVIIASWGPVAIAAHKVGTQIEAISYLTADGMGTAMSSFTGQNYGARNDNRVRKGIKVGEGFALSWGIFTGILMVIFGKQIFSIFINEKDAILVGSAYLTIIGYSQPGNCAEIISGGIFKGLGRTILPSFVGIFFNLMRIPMAIFLSRPEMLGLNGVWWTISVSTMFKGGILLLAMLIRYKRNTLYVNGGILR